MKLHLPKLLLSALLATFVVASYTYAEDISLNPLSSENGWDYSKRNNDKKLPTYSNGSITLADNWAQNLASWQQTGVLYDVGSTGEMTFSATLSETGTGGVLGLALVGSTQTIVLGAPQYGSGANLWYAISDNVSADVFLADSSGWENNRVVANVPSSDLKALGTCGAGTPFTIDGTVKRTQTGTYSLTLKFDNVEVVSDLDLGYTMDLSRVAFYSDGAGGVNATLSQLTVTGVSEYHIKDVIWNGQTSWNHRDQVWLDRDNGNAVAFHQMDNVTFGTHAEGVGSTVTISEEVTASTITVNDQYVFNLAENSILRGDITVNTDAGLALKGSGRFMGVLSGSGVLSFDGVDGLISGEANAIAVSELTITDATVATERFQSNGGTSIIKAGTLVNIGKGGRLQLNGHDMLGWGNNSPARIVLQSDDAEKLAVFDIQDSGSLTLKTALELKGNALVEGTSFNTLGTSIAVTGTNNEIASEFQVRDEVTVTVAADGELLISGSIKNNDNGGNHNIIKSGDGLLKISGTIDAGYTGTISVTAGGLSTKKYSSQANLQQLISYEADTKISTIGKAFILLNSGAYLLNDSALVTISNKNYHVAGDFELNGYGNNVSDASRSLIVQNGKSFTVDGNLYIATRGKLEIKGGHVTARTMSLGHTDNGVYQGYLAMLSGSLTSGTITLNNTHSNSIDITGGTVEFTTATALSRGQNTASTINITGTSADAPVVLKASKAAWTLDGSGLTAAPTLGNIKVDAGNTHAITLKNVALSGSVVNNAVLNLDGAVTLKDGVFLSGNAVTLNSTGTVTFSTLDYSTNSSYSSSLGQISGSGIVKVSNGNTSDDYKETFVTNSDFTGTLYVTAGNFNFNPDSTNVSKLQLGAGVNMQFQDGKTYAGEIALDSGSHEIHVNSSESFTIAGSVTGDSVFDKLGGGQLHITGGTGLYGLSSSGGGAVTITAENFVIGGTATYDPSKRYKGIYLKESTLNIGDGSKATKVVTQRVEMGDIDDVNKSDVLNVKKKATLVITGNGDEDYHKAGLLLGEWNTKSTLNIDGSVFSKNAAASYGDAQTVINVNDGGLLATKGVTAAKMNADSKYTQSITLNLNDGAKLLLGETGICFNDNTDTVSVTFGKAEIGMTAETSITENVTLSHADGTTFNTALYTWNEAGDAVTAGTTGGNMVVSGNLSGSGKLVKTGAGTLELSGTNTYSGGTEVQAGKLVATKGAALGNGNVVVKGGAVEITDGTGKITVEQRKADTDATINKTGGDTYSAESDDFIITGAAVSVKSDSTVTLGNNLQNSKVINDGVGELKLTNANNVLTDIEAKAGSISMESLANKQALESLYIGDALTVNVGSATLSIQEAAINQQGARVTNVTFGDNAKLQGNLVLQSGAALSLGENVQIDGTLTLGNDMTLTGAQLEEIKALQERVELFHNVDQLKLTDARVRSGAALDYTQAQDLRDFFSNVDSGVYLLEFDSGVVYATLIPEPATGTLSLLALAALAARRRRRH